MKCKQRWLNSGKSHSRAETSPHLSIINLSYPGASPDDQEELEADAVLGLTDSDFGGGGTNADGFILKGTYAFHKKWNAKFTYFDNEIGLNTGNPKDYGRLQLDLNFMVWKLLWRLSVANQNFNKNGEGLSDARAN